jgi:hypothetical protein
VGLEHLGGDLLAPVGGRQCCTMQAGIGKSHDPVVYLIALEGNPPFISASPSCPIEAQTSVKITSAPFAASAGSR